MLNSTCKLFKHGMSLNSLSKADNRNNYFINFSGLVTVLKFRI